MPLCEQLSSPPTPRYRPSALLQPIMDHSTLKPSDRDCIPQINLHPADEDPRLTASEDDYIASDSRLGLEVQGQKSLILRAIFLYRCTFIN
jgi:hypothetical protein